MKQQLFIKSVQFDSPLGELIACATTKGICFLGFVGQKQLNKRFEEIEKELKATIISGTNPHLELVQEELKAYFSGELQEFSTPLDIIGTDFRQQVWAELLNIPYGKTISYKEQAIAMDNVKAIRAMATSNGANKIAIIIPCHRVIGSNGKLIGYASGLDKKKWLLDFERKNSNQAIQTELDFG